MLRFNNQNTPTSYCEVFMPSPLVECIPNFSEARRPEIVEQIIQAILEVPGVQVLDKHSDLDHNRTVVTYVGAPAPVEEAAFRAIACAAQAIDLNQHSGEHPRIGATDVVPFVPISDITMQECIEMARRLGKRVAAELNIPVYLYEEAASRPDRQNLENIRRGQYEGLKEDILVNPERQPDFGPSSLGKAGATVIGARQPLVAFNAYLTTEDVSIAQKIAKAVRNSSGGLRFVKAMGILVNGRAQVSMNLTNYRQTPVFRVIEMVRREAARYGVAIHHSELVGLIPQEALTDTAVWYLQLDDFNPEQILEQRLYEALAKQPDIKVETPEPTFLDQLAAGVPTPGGGSAAAYAGAAGAALVAMVARLTVGKKKYITVEPQMWPLIDQAEALRAHLTEMIAIDSAAFDAIIAATRLAKVTPEEQSARAAAIEQATLHAAEVPLQTAEMAVKVIELAVQAASLGNLNAISDAVSGASLARAALTGASLNVRINCKSLQNPASGDLLIARLAELEQQANQFEKSIQTVLRERAGLS
jgi:glutamate formiminotransferase / formiminotetrahydrofolate cyclodeaminase